MSTVVGGGPTVGSINGRRAGSFNGTQGLVDESATWLSITTSSGQPGFVCIYVVQPAISALTNQAVWGCVNASDARDQLLVGHLYTNGQAYKHFRIDNTILATGNTVTPDLRDGQPHIVVVRDKISGTGAGVWLRVDGADAGGATEASPSTTNSNQNAPVNRSGLGVRGDQAAYFMQGEIGRVLYFRDASAVDIDGAEAALAAEWGISI